MLKAETKPNVIYPVRIPYAIYVKLKKLAEKGHCSVNSVMLVLIEKGLETK